jgi:chromosome partitioning protein
LNAKGGCGKTTIATNLASYFASQGRRTVLMDHDPQGSSRRWLELRDDSLPEIRSIDAVNQRSGVTRSWQLHAGQDAEVLITDTPAGTNGSQLIDLVRQADVILVPVMPSIVDMQATADFIHGLLRYTKIPNSNKKLGIIANRVREGTRSYKALVNFLADYDIPLAAQLRDTQHYVNAMEEGMGIHELCAKQTTKDRAQWKPLIDWLNDESEAAFSTPNTLSTGQADLFSRASVSY